MRKLLLGFGVVLAAFAASHHDWKTGILKATAFQNEEVGARAHAFNFPNYGGPYAPAMSTATARTITLLWEGFLVEDGGYQYALAFQVRQKALPNVTVNGSLRYCIEKSKAYLFDEDGKEFAGIVLQKTLLPTPK